MIKDSDPNPDNMQNRETMIKDSAPNSGNTRNRETMKKIVLLIPEIHETEEQ